MRIVFMGTPPAAVPSLRAVARDHEVASVFTQPDRPKGRGLHRQPSAVKTAAGELGLEVAEPRSLRHADEQERLKELAPEVVVVVAFGQILPPEVLDTPPLGCVNVHFSLLPRWRGAAPVERAIMAGDALTGVTTMLMDPGLDTGPVLLSAEQGIEPTDTAGSLTQRLAAAGAELIGPTLEGLAASTLTARPQPDEGVTYAAKITPADSRLEPERPGRELERVVRALDPAPGAFLSFRGKRLKVWRASQSQGEGTPGTVATAGEEGLDLQTAEGRLRLLEVQPEGKKRMSAEEFVRGYRPSVGEEWGRS